MIDCYRTPALSFSLPRERYTAQGALKPKRPQQETRLAKAEISIIGGSGLYNMDGLTNVTEHRIETPFGDPS